MADLESSILIKILDAFTGPLRKLTDGLGAVEGAGEKAKAKLRLAADLNQAAEAAGRFGQMLIGPVRGAVEEFAEFDHALSKLSAMGGGDRGSPVFEAMKQQAMDLGAATQYSATEVAELQTNFLKANFSTAETMAAVTQTLAAATAEGIGLAETSTIVAGALRGMGLQVSETARVTDVLALASVKSDADMRGLSEGLSYVAPLASKAGMSFELTTAMLGKLSDAQIKGSQAGTALRAVLSRLVDPSKDARAAFERMGIGAGKLRDIQKDVASGKIDEALRKIGEASNKLPDAKQLELLSRIFGMEASTGAQVLIRSTLDTSDMGLGALTEQLKRAEGQTQKMADTMQDDLQGSLERAGGALSGLNTAIGEAFAPTVKSASASVEDLAGALSSWVKRHPEATEATMNLVAGLGLVSLGMKGVLLTASAYQSLNAGIIAARIPIAQMTAANWGLVGAAGAAGWAVGTWLSEVMKVDKSMRDAALRARGIAGGSTDEQGISASDPVQTYAGGWSYNRVTGEVKAGTGAAPKSLQARIEGAEQRGATPGNMEEVSAILAADAAANRSAFRAAGGMLATTADAAALASPAKTVDRKAPTESTYADPMAALDALIAARNADLTDPLKLALREQKRSADMLEKIEKRTGRGGMVGGPIPLGR